MTDAFRKLDVDDKGYIDEATAIKATQTSERQPYDVVRQALKEVELDSSRRVELEDYVGVCSPLPSQLCRGGANYTESQMAVQRAMVLTLSPSPARRQAP